MIPPFFMVHPTGQWVFRFSNILELIIIMETSLMMTLNMTAHGGFGTNLFSIYENNGRPKRVSFLATVFTVSSHEPYVIPKEYEGKFPRDTFQYINVWAIQILLLNNF